MTLLPTKYLSMTASFRRRREPHGLRQPYDLEYLRGIFMLCQSADGILVALSPIVDAQTFIGVGELISDRNN